MNRPTPGPQSKADSGVRKSLVRACGRRLYLLGLCLDAEQQLSEFLRMRDVRFVRAFQLNPAPARLRLHQLAGAFQHRMRGLGAMNVGLRQAVTDRVLQI